MKNIIIQALGVLVGSALGSSFMYIVYLILPVTSLDEFFMGFGMMTWMITILYLGIEFSVWLVKGEPEENQKDKEYESN